MLSIVLPAYDEEGMVEAAASALAALMDRERIDYELVFVDDGSTDGTLRAIERVCRENPRACGVSFSRNFGKEAAIFAGLAQARGDCCAVMDCDLQHPPETLAAMYRFWEQGAEVVEGVKRSRGKESALHGAFARVFYRLISRATGVDMRRASDFKLLDRRAVDALLSMSERSTFFRALSTWVGFRQASVEFDVQERTQGRSKWSSWSLVRYAVTNILSFTAAPLQFVTMVGAALFLFGCVMSVQTLLRWLSGSAVEGFTTVILLILITGSLIMLSLGIIGLYLAKIYEEVKRRPRYLISKVVRAPQDTPRPGGDAAEAPGADQPGADQPGADQPGA